MQYKGEWAAIWANSLNRLLLFISPPHLQLNLPDPPSQFANHLLTLLDSPLCNSHRSFLTRKHLLPLICRACPSW